MEDKSLAAIQSYLADTKHTHLRTTEHGLEAVKHGRLWKVGHALYKQENERFASVAHAALGWAQAHTEDLNNDRELLSQLTRFFSKAKASPQLQLEFAKVKNAALGSVVGEGSFTPPNWPPPEQGREQHLRDNLNTYTKAFRTQLTDHFEKLGIQPENLHFHEGTVRADEMLEEEEGFLLNQFNVTIDATYTYETGGRVHQGKAELWMHTLQPKGHYRLRNPVEEEVARLNADYRPPDAAARRHEGPFDRVLLAKGGERIETHNDMLPSSLADAVQGDLPLLYSANTLNLYLDYVQETQAAFEVSPDQLRELHHLADYLVDERVLPALEAAINTLQDQDLTVVLRLPRK